MKRAISHIGMYMILLGAFGLIAALLFSVITNLIFASICLGLVIVLTVVCKVKLKIHFV